MADSITSPVSPGSPGSPRRMHKRVEDASELMWNNRYDEAEAIFAPRRGSNPRVALEHALMYFAKSFLSSTNEKREALLDLFKHADGLATASKYGEPLISDSSDEEDEDIARAAQEDCTDISAKDKEKIKELLEKKAKQKEAYKKRIRDAVKTGGQVDSSWKLECDVIYADALLVRSLIQLFMNSYLKGGINLRKAWGCYWSLMQEVEKDTQKTIPEEIRMNIMCGAGTFYTYTSLAPASLMKLLSAIGFISDKELGEQYLTTVFQSNTIRSPYAALVLCTYYLFLPTGLGNVDETLSKAKKVLDTMNARFPDNTHFHGYSNFYHRKRGETKEAVEAIVRANANAEKAKDGSPLLLRYLYADTLYMDLQFEEAKAKYHQVLQSIIAEKVTFGYTGQVVMNLAACYVISGDDKTALDWLKKVSSMYNPKSKQDANSPKFSAKVLYEPRLLPLLPVYMLYINRDLAHMHSDNVAKLRAELNRVCEGRDLSTPEVMGMYQLFQGVMHKATGDKDAAMAEWTKTVALEKKLASDSMVLPYTLYEMGELEYRRGNHANAKLLLEKGASLKGDGHETLANRYSIALKQLKRAMAEQK